jgi:hypothetical protein
VINWFVVSAAMLYFAAGVKSATENNWPWVGVWFCYGVANLLLTYAEYRGT